MPTNESLRRASALGLIFIIVAIIAPIVTMVSNSLYVRWYQTIEPWTLDVVFAIIHGIIFIPLLALLVLSMRGFAYLGEKFGNTYLVWATYAHGSIVIVILCLMPLEYFRTLSDVGYGLSATVYRLIGLAFAAYGLCTAIIALIAFNLRSKLSTAIYPLIVIGVWFLYWIYIQLAPDTYPHFLGYWLVVPIPEIILVAVSRSLFIQASKY